MISHKNKVTPKAHSRCISSGGFIWWKTCCLKQQQHCAVSHQGWSVDAHGSWYRKWKLKFGQIPPECQKRYESPEIGGWCSTYPCGLITGTPPWLGRRGRKRLPKKLKMLQKSLSSKQCKYVQSLLWRKVNMHINCKMQVKEIKFLNWPSSLALGEVKGQQQAATLKQPGEYQAWKNN